MSWLLFLPAAALILFVSGAIGLWDTDARLAGVNLADPHRAVATQTFSSPTTRPPTAADLPTLAPEARLILDTPAGPQPDNERAPTQSGKPANALPAATNAAVVPVVEPVTGQSNEPAPAVATQAPPPPPPDTAIPPPPAVPTNTPPPVLPTDTPPPVPPTGAPPVVADVTLCHMPGGDPSKAETKTLSPEAAVEHLAHGDTLGPCP